ncbi:MAG: flagellar FlbD family protein [Arthrobacter sp.]
MIVLTRLNGSSFAVNPDLLERIYENPDTTLAMVNGGKYIVMESIAEVIDRITDYRARVLWTAQEHLSEHPRRLSVVSDNDARPETTTPGK